MSDVSRRLSPLFPPLRTLIVEMVKITRKVRTRSRKREEAKEKPRRRKKVKYMARYTSTLLLASGLHMECSYLLHIPSLVQCPSRHLSDTLGGCEDSVLIGGPPHTRFFTTTKVQGGAKTLAMTFEMEGNIQDR